MQLTRRHWLGLTSALAATAAVGTPATAASATVTIRNPGRRDPAPLIQAVGDYAAIEVARYALPGLTMAIVGPDGLDATLTFGYADLGRRLPVTPDHLFQIGSITKSAVALCLYRLADRGLVDLDATAAAILPDIPWPDAQPPITIAMLLNHSAALSTSTPIFPRSPDGRHWTNYPPGQHYAYSNAGFRLLGMIAPRISGMPVHRALRELVLTPLGMNATEPLILTRDRARYAVGYAPFSDAVYFPGDPLVPGPWLDMDNASGSIASTPGDMARYLAFLVRLARGDGAPLLSPALARRFLTPTIAANDFGPDARYAAGLATVPVDGRRCIHHTGGMLAFQSSMTIDPEAGGIFASTNCGAGHYRPRGITDHGCRLLRAFVERRPLPPPPAVVPVPPIVDPARLAGSFIAANGDRIALTLDGDAPRITADGAVGRLQQAGSETFLTDHPRLAKHAVSFAAGHDRLWWGGTLYGRDRPLPTPPVAPALAGLAGTYMSNDPWIGGMSIVARGDVLIAEGLGMLIPIAGGWRVDNEEVGAERLWFDARVNGRAERLIFSGVDLRRFHDTEG